jgi:hypothetical protein
MKRTALVACLIVVTAGSGFSWFLGSRVRLAHERFVAAMIGTGDIRIRAERFDAGWFSSVAEIEAELGGVFGESLQSWLAAAGQKHARARVGFHVRQEIDHGPRAWWHWLTAVDGPPIFAEVVTELALDQEARADWATGQRPLTALTRLRTFGPSDTAVSIPEQQVRVRPDEDSGGPGAAAEWRGLYAYLIHPLGSGRLEGTVTGQGLVRETGAERLRLGPYEARFELSPASDGSLRASVRGELASFALETVGDPEAGIRMDTLRLDAVLERGDEVLALGITASSELARFGDVDASRALAHFELRDVHVGLLDALAADTPQQDAEAALAELGQWLERAPSIDPLELEIDTDRGRIHVTGRLQIDAAAAADPTAVLDHLGAELRIDVDDAPAAALVPGVHAMLVGMAEDGLLRRTASGVRGLLVLENGAWRRMPPLAEAPEEPVPALADDRDRLAIDTLDPATAEASDEVPSLAEVLEERRDPEADGVGAEETVAPGDAVPAAIAP